MKKNKLLNLLLRGSSVKSGAGGGGSGGGGSSAAATQNSSGAQEISEGSAAPNPVIQRHSTRRSRHSVRDADGAAGVERSSSWKYTHDHTPDSFSINSSPSILDGRSGRSEESHTPVIEKSQSWSGDRVLDCTTDSGSSRGGTGTNNSSRAGSTACSRAGSRSGSRTGTGSRSSKERGSGGQINSHGGSERGDSTPSSVYEQVADDTSRNEQVTSFNAQSPKDDSAPYENVDIPSPQRDSGDSSSGQRSSSRLSVKSNRRSRRSSPRRPGGSPQPGMGQGLPHQDSRTSRSGSVRGGVPSISLVTSSPTPSRLTTRGYSRSPSRERTVVTAQQVAPPRDTWVPQPVPQQYHPHTILPATMGRYGDQILGTAPRSISHEEQSMSQIHRGPHLMTKARSWQHHSHDGSSGTPQSERARQLAKSRSWQQQHSMVLGHSMEAGRARPQHITRQQAVVQTQMIGKSRSWQQSHEADPIPGPLPRTYTVNEAQRRARRSSVRLAPPSPSRGLSPSRVHSQSRNHSPARTHSPSRPQSRTHSPARSHSPGRSPLSPVGSRAQTSAAGSPHYPDQPPFTRMQQQQHIHQHLHHQHQQHQQHQQQQRQQQQQQKARNQTPPQVGDYMELRDYEQLERSQYADLHQYRRDNFRRDALQHQAYRQPNVSREDFGAAHIPPFRQMEGDYASLHDIQRGEAARQQGRVPAHGVVHSGPVKSTSLMTSAELLNTLKRQLALSSPTRAPRSKSLEAGRAASMMEAQLDDPNIISSGMDHVVAHGPFGGRLSPALQALVAEKRARLKRSTGVFSGSSRIPRVALLQRQFTAPYTRCSLGTGLTSDSECEDKKSSASSTAGGGGGSAAVDGQAGGVPGVGRAFTCASPQPTVVSSQDYNMEQSQVTLLRAELKIVTKDRDIMKKELKKVTRERDEALTRLASSSGVTEPNNYGTMSKVEKNLPRDYEGLKMQCEKAMAEVQALHKQNIEITRKYENAMKDVEYYRKQERAAYGALQSLRVKYEEVVAEKQKLEHEVTSLQSIMEDDRKEIADLRRQQQKAKFPLKRQEAMTQEGSGETINQLYLTAVRNYEAIKDEYDNMRKRYSDLVASHSNNISKLELTQEEVNRLKKQYEDVMGECSSAVREKNCLKQQCTEAIRQWDSALREKNKIQEELLKTREKYDEMMKEMNTHLIQRQHLNKDLKRLQEERNAAMQEYTLVMSERDTVHKEMDKLQDELGQANKRIKNIEQNSKDAGKERGSLLLQIETLQREIAAALNDRDKALKECNDIKERFGAKEDTNKEWERSCHDYDNYKQEREMTLKEGSDVGSSAHDMYSKAQKERLDNLDQANQEIDRLRKQIEKLQNELQEAQQEAEVSKRRRDWAFSERDKIVLERESIRAHCDKLRRERDRAVSELAEALRDSDDMKKQRNEASKELKELKERVEAEQEKAAVVRQLTAHNHSRDSAIDTDLHEWETETLHLHIGIVSEREIGFELGGGRDDPHYGGNDGAVYITSLAKEGPFDGKLRLHDQIVRVNGIECRGLDRGSVIQAVVNGGGIVHMTVRRRRIGGRSLHTAHLHCLHLHHGITLQTGFYITNILHGSPAAREGSLTVGDRVININGKPADNINNCEEAQQLLDTAGDIVQLTTLKSHGSSSSSAPLSSSSSGHNITEDDKSTASSRPYSNPASPAKDISYVSSSGRVGRKLVPGSGSTLQGEEGGGGGGRKYGSNERVYNVTKASGEKGSGSGPWDHFKSIVKPRKHSKERSESRDKEDKKKHMSPSLEQDKDLALAQLDSVIDSYHSKTSSSSGGGTSTTKRSKKRDKEKSGGTWPKYRGGGSNTWDGVTSTVIHTQRRRERQPLSVLPSCSISSQYACEEKPYDLYHRDKRGSPRSTSSPHNPSSARSSGFPIYKSPDSKGITYSNPGPSYQQSSSLIYSTQSSVMFSSQSSYTTSSPRNVSVERKSEESEHDRDRLSSLTPSDTSIDLSVTSGNMGKEVLEYYVKKNRGKYPQSDSESNMSPVETCAPQSLSLPPVYGSRPSPLHHGGERTPSHSRISHPHAGPYSPPSTTMRSPTAFASYSPVSHLPLTHSHSHPHTSIGASIPNPLPRYSSPPTILSGGSHFLPSARSGDSILSSPSDRDSRDRYDRFASSPTPLSVSGIFYHSATPSLEIGGMPHKPRTVHLHPYRADEPQLPLSHTSGPPSYHDYQLSIGTLSRKVKEEERLRIASNASVGSKSSSSKGGSMERSSELGSPMPPSYSVEMTGGNTGRQQHITHISHSVHSPDYSQYWQRKPHPGDLRHIYIEKSLEPLGIQIRCLDNGGVFVSSVSVKSLASKVGLCVGDQLLEVCGINMRSATKQLATTVLSQCGNSITILVQYNPDKYREAEGSEGSSSDPGAASRSGSPTPCNSPKPAREPPMQVDEMPPSSTSTLRGPLDSAEHQHDHSPLDHSLPPSARSTLTRPEVTRVINTLSRQDTFLRRSENGGSSSGSGGNGSSSSSDTRLVYLELNKCHNLGIQMVGGNAVGIYVHAVMSESPAAKAGLRPGDRILEYNGVDLRSATAEQAAFELAKPADKVTMLVQCDYQRYEEVQDQPGDSFYIRALFDRWGEVGDSTDLRFRKEDILYVDNTMFNNVPGQWRAWVVDEDGHKRQCGTIPSKDKVEEEIVLQRSLGDLHMDSSRRGSTSARRSFFRRKKHSRSSSRDSKELASFSDASLNSYTEAAPLHDEPIPSSYIRVERLDYLVRRPLVLVGPLWELVCDKLVHDFPHKFTRCHPEIRRSSTQAMEAAVQENIIVDYRRRGSHFEATTVQQVKEICDKSCHGILDLSLSSVERLHRHNIYPIVLLLKFRHHKQIREVFDSHPTAEKISQKEAKEMYELSTKIEQEYKHLISAEITAGVNLAYICTHVKSCVDQEQSKTLWVPSGTI